MKPWCAEGEVPTAANLNICCRWTSCVGWHCDDEPLFGECGEAKLIVSASFGSSALFKWKGKSCLENEAHLRWLDHGDILVMDGQCQDEFLHCMDPGLEQELINVTFRWIKQHAPSCSFLRAGVACRLPTCAQGSSVPVTGIVENGVSWAFWLLLGTLFQRKVLRCWFYPSYLQDSGHGDVPIAGHAFWAEVGGGITFVTSGEDCWAAHKTAKYLCETICGKPFVQALAGQRSLCGYCACWFIGLRGHSGEIAGKKQCETSFSPYRVFCLVGTLYIGGGSRSSGIFGLAGLGTLPHPTVGCR